MRIAPLRAALAIVAAAGALAWALPSTLLAQEGKAMPEFRYAVVDAWLNSKPLTGRQLRGKVVLVDLFTTGWGGCKRSVPWVHGIEQKYGTQGLMAVAVHSPAPYVEASTTRNPNHVKSVADDYGIKEPVYVDHDRAFFEALGAQYHPTFYVVDKKGRIRIVEQGAQVAGSDSTKRMEALIQQLLKEPS